MIEREHIGIFGKMNAGKSSLMNLITMQNTSIVDSKRGTTADNKVALHEIHGIGAVKIFDTAGYDESGELGDKKRAKVDDTIRECDLVMIVIDPDSDNFNYESTLISKAGDLSKRVVVIYNLFKKSNSFISLPEFDSIPSIALSVKDSNSRLSLISFIGEHIIKKGGRNKLIPWIKEDHYYLLVVPMDEETPSGRLLRPQEMSMEFLIRERTFPVVIRPDLAKLRCGDRVEIERFRSLVESLGDKLDCVITDSQAIDVIADLVPDKISLTTFSIMMINHTSQGDLKSFFEGAKVISKLKRGDKVLIVEACNHDRIAEDIGVVQIPKLLANKIEGLEIEHNFGREFFDNSNLDSYSLIIHCGGCMITQQKMKARVVGLKSLGVPYTNYGIFLSMFHNPATAERVVKPWVS